MTRKTLTPAELGEVFEQMTEKDAIETLFELLYRRGWELTKDLLFSFVDIGRAYYTRTKPGTTNPATEAKHACGFSEHGFYDYARHHSRDNKIS